MEESAFIRVFGRSPVVKLLDFLLVERGLYDYSMSEISENADVSWTTLHRIFPELLALGVVKKTRQVGRASMYAVNEMHPLTKDLIEMRAKISDYFAESELLRQAEAKSALPAALPQ